MLFTPEFQAKHGTLVKLFSAATTWPGSRWTLAAEPTNANLVLTVLTTNSAWRMRDPDNVVTARVLLDIMSVATGGTM